MTRSDSIGQLAAALATAQAEIQNAAKTKKNPHLGSRYADLASVWDACREPLSRNGLAVVQPLSVEDGYVTVHTMLIHASGEWIRGTIAIAMPTEAKLSIAQAMGSIITYLRRYSLAAMVGVAPDDDEDGNGNAAASNAPPSATGGAAPAVSGVWEGPGQCSKCHAPAGKPHGKPCSS